MSRLSSSVLEPLAKAMSRAYRNPTELSALLIPLGQRFDDLTSQRESLLTNAREIVFAAQEQGWSGDLLLALLKDRPNNADVRALADMKPEVIEGPVLSRQRNPVDRPSLTCGRAGQWNQVCQCAPTRVHQVLLVPGSLGQATLHFRDRVEVWLSTDPSRSMVTVHWPSPPRSLGELLERLAFALQVDEKSLEQAIADRLATRNLYVLHPCLSADFHGSQFLEYYTKWWPATLAKTQTPYHVKCVQPVEWPVNPSTPQSWWRRLMPDDEPKAQAEAHALIETLAKQAMGVRIVTLDELFNLQPHEIDQFLEASEFNDDQRHHLSGQLTGGPQVPAFMFKLIDDYWREVSAGR